VQRIKKATNKRLPKKALSYQNYLVHVLIAAIACLPRGGSEGYVGWSTVNAVAQDHDVHVITSGAGRLDIEKEMVDHPFRAKLTFSYIHQPSHWHENRLIARFQSWIAYIRWVNEASIIARWLCEKEKFDLSHHVTYATWRMGTPLAGLGIPLVFGPVGGGEQFPARFLIMLSPLSVGFELARIISGWVAIKSKRVVEATKKASLILANNNETRELLTGLGVKREKIKLMSQSFLSAAKMTALRCETPKSPPREKLKIFAGGNLEGRKGVAIILEGLAILKKWSIPFEFTYGGRGPELGHLQRLSSKLHLPAAQVRIGVTLSSDDYIQALKASHIYLLPSLREGAPVTMIEAMAASCVPVVGKCGGAAMLVTQDCGRLISITSPRQMAVDIAKEIRHLFENSDALGKLAKAASERVAAVCSENSYRNQINEHYEAVVGKAKT
jgi:glycosyltransferase involved in cell wall biosynthesis